MDPVYLNQDTLVRVPTTRPTLDQPYYNFTVAKGKAREKQDFVIDLTPELQLKIQNLHKILIACSNIKAMPAGNRTYGSSLASAAISNSRQPAATPAPSAFSTAARPTTTSTTATGRPATSAAARLTSNTAGRPATSYRKSLNTSTAWPTVAKRREAEKLSSEAALAALDGIGDEENSPVKANDASQMSTSTPVSRTVNANQFGGFSSPSFYGTKSIDKENSYSQSIQRKLNATSNLKQQIRNGASPYVTDRNKRKAGPLGSGLSDRSNNTLYFPSSSMSVKTRCFLDDLSPVRSTPSFITPLLSKPKRLFGESLGSEREYKGFVNLGNTCYMNATLQALFSLDPLTKQLCRTYQSLRLQESSKNLLLRSLTKLLTHRNSTRSREKENYLETVKQSISEKVERFTGDMQHDAQEFLGQVLDQLKDETRDCIAALEQIEPDNISNPIVDNFELEISHSIICQYCSEVSRRVELFNFLSVELPMVVQNDKASTEQATNVQQCLDAFMRSEELEYKCEKCNIRQQRQEEDNEQATGGGPDAIVQHKISKLPRVLVIHLKRYLFDAAQERRFKMVSRVVIPSFITLEHHVEANAEKAAPLSQTICKINPSAPGAIPSTPTRASHTATTTTPQSSGSVARCLLKDDVKSTNNSVKTTPNSKYKFYNTPELNRAAASKKDGIEPMDCSEVAKVDETDERPEATMTEEEALEEAKRQSLLEQQATKELVEDDDDLKKVLEMSMREEQERERRRREEEEAMELVLQQSMQDESAISLLDEPVEADIIENFETGALPNSYRLVAIVSHIGTQAKLGHYVTDAYDSSKKHWYMYDDTVVTETKETDARRSRETAAYVLFYVAKDFCDNGDTSPAASNSSKL